MEMTRRTCMVAAKTSAPKLLRLRVVELLVTAGKGAQDRGVPDEGGVDAADGDGQTRMFDHIMWVNLLIQEMIGQKLEVDLRTDCKSLVDNMNSLRVQVSEKRLTAEMWTLRNAKDQKEINSFLHIGTDSMLADGLTKSKPQLRVKLTDTMYGHKNIYKQIKTKRKIE